MDFNIFLRPLGLVSTYSSTFAPWPTFYSHYFCGLTDEDGHRLTASANPSASHCCHLHLVKHSGHQALQQRGQRVSIHCLVTVVSGLVVTTSAHAPNLFAYRKFAINFFFKYFTF